MAGAQNDIYRRDGQGMAGVACVLFYQFYGFAFDLKPHHITYFATCVDADPALYHRAAVRELLCVYGET
jgi:hypothetical protein